MRDYFFKTWYVPVASQVAERLKTYDLRKLGNIRKVSKVHRMLAYCPVFLQTEYFLNTSKTPLKNRN